MLTDIANVGLREGSQKVHCGSLQGILQPWEKENVKWQPVGPTWILQATHSRRHAVVYGEWMYTNHNKIQDGGLMDSEKGWKF